MDIDWGSAVGGMRERARVAGVPVVHLGGVEAPWATRAYLLDGHPGDAVLAEVGSWLAEHGWHGFQLRVRERDAADPGWARCGWRVDDALPVFAVDAAQVGALLSPSLGGFEVAVPRDRAEFVDAYGSWMDDPALAEALVCEEDLSDSRWMLRVGRAAGRSVGSAMVRFGTGTGYVSGIGVHRPDRRRGYGTALTVEAARLAAGGVGGGGRDVDARSVDVVWMHASSEGAPLYAGLGFTQVDTHVLLAPS